MPERGLLFRRVSYDLHMLAPVAGEDPMDTLRQIVDEPEPRKSKWKRLLGG
jgi:hypothetical protein